MPRVWLLLMLAACSVEHDNEVETVARKQVEVSAFQSLAVSTHPAEQAILEWMRAVKALDAEAFRDCYVVRIRNDIDDGTWEQNVATARSRLLGLLGTLESDSIEAWSSETEEGVTVHLRGSGGERVLELPLVLDSSSRWRIALK